MAESRQGFAFVKRGAAVMLAVTLAAGMVPTVALAQEGITGAIALTSVAMGDGYYLEEGKTYTVPVSWKNASTDAESMAASYLNATASVRYMNGQYAIGVSASEKGMSELLSVSLGGIAASSMGSGSFQVISNTVNGKIVLALTIKTMQSMGMGAVSVGMVLDTSSLPTTPPATPIDRSVLESALVAAAAIEQGSKTNDAWAILQQAIVAAQAVLGSDSEGQANIDNTVLALSASIETFNVSTDATPGVNPGVQLEVGKTYSVPVTFTQKDGSVSMAGKMIDSNATVKVNQGSFDVSLVVKAGEGYEFRSLRLGEEKTPTTLTHDDAGNYVFSGNVASLEGTVEVGFTYYVAAMNREMNHSAFAAFDVANAIEKATASKPPEIAVDKSQLEAELVAAKTVKQADKTDNAWAALQDAIASAETVMSGASVSQSGADGAAQSLRVAVAAFNSSAPKEASVVQQAAAFQVGHTYQVPLSFLKSGSSEASMAAQYFGDTALVRPQSDGTFEVSFSTNRLDYIKGLSYKGSEVSLSGSQYTLSIVAATADVTLPVTMSIQPMILLGGGDVAADLRLHLTKATDLGTGKESVTASSAGALAKTGDPLSGTATAVAMLAVAGAVSATAARRRFEGK